jgi:hypothetical protein
MSDLDSERVTAIIYNALERCLKPDSLDSFIRRGQKARGSMSVHGFMKLLGDVHYSRKRKQIHDRANDLPRPTGNG